MKRIPALLAGLLLTVGLASTDSAASAEQPSPIHFGAIGWESGALTTEILRLILNSMTEGVIVCDQHGKTLLVKRCRNSSLQLRRSGVRCGRS